MSWRLNDQEVNAVILPYKYGYNHWLLHPHGATFAKGDNTVRIESASGDLLAIVKFRVT